MWSIDTHLARCLSCLIDLNRKTRTKQQLMICFRVFAGCLSSFQHVLSLSLSRFSSLGVHRSNHTMATWKKTNSIPASWRWFPWDPRRRYSLRIMNHFIDPRYSFDSNRRFLFDGLVWPRSLICRKHRSHLDFYSHEREGKRHSSRSFTHRFYRIYRSLSMTVTLFLRFFLLINQIIRTLWIFMEKILRIIHLVHGWIAMLRSIFSALHLLVARLMNLSFKIYRIFYLLSILFEPFSDRTFEKAVRSFSRFLYDYYSSNGACYTLKARTHHILTRVRARWKNTSSMIDDDEIFYDALNDEKESWSLFCSMFVFLYSIYVCTVFIVNFLTFYHQKTQSIWLSHVQGGDE